MSGRERKVIVRRPTVAVPDDLLQRFHPVLARVLAQREIDSPDELEFRLERLPGFSGLLGVERAAGLLAEALERRERILVVGDFDADGATSTALALRGLTALGAADVQFLVPNRFEYGYGLTPEIVAAALPLQPRLLLTVDNGISSFAGVAAARAAGVRVVITDHHLPAPELPDADAIVNPNLPEDAFPSKALAGVGVMFYLLVALRALLRRGGWFERCGIEPPNLAQWLDLVALGTVADVVPLDAVNRILVAQGMARIRAGRCIPGISALLEAAGRRHQRAVTADLGFAVAPRLNAAGRLDDMAVGIHCLLTDDAAAARTIAAQLDELNRERRGIEGQMRDEALALLRRLGSKADEAYGICLYDPEWHEGVIGILASRVRERMHRPVCVFTRSQSGELKGSARSVPGVHIRDLLERVAARQPGLLLRFGGHAMAAGMAVAPDRLDEFRHAFAAEARAQLGAEELRGVVLSDGGLEEGDLTLDLAEQLRIAAPWGQGFPEPLFDGAFRVAERRIVGERHLQLKLVTPAGRSLDGIAFNYDADFDPAPGALVRAGFRLDVSEYRGRQLSLRTECLLPADGA